MYREKQIMALYPYIVGRRIKIFTQIPGSHWAVAEVDAYSGRYLYLKNIVIWNGAQIKEKRIGIASISKIEYDN